MKSLNKFLKEIDVFGNMILLNFQGKQLIKSSIGGIISLIYYCSIIVIIICSSYYYSINNPPIWNVKNQFRANNTIETIDKNDLFIANNFINAKSILPKSYKTIPQNIKFNSIRSEIKDFQNIINSTILGEFSKCKYNSNHTSIPKEDYNLFLRRFNETALCFNFLNDLKIGGEIYKSQEMQKGYLKFNINICDIIETPGCKSEDIIESNKNTKSLKLRYFYNNHYTNINDFNGYSTFFNTGELDIDLFYNYEINLIFQKNILQTDRNLIYSFFPLENKVFYIIKMELNRKLNTDLNLAPNINNLQKNGNYTLKISYDFLLDDTEVIWERSYVKLTTLLGNIYSMSRLVYYLLKYLVFYISDGYFNYKFSKKISVFKKKKSMNMSENNNFFSINRETNKIFENKKEFEKKCDINESGEKATKNYGSKTLDDNECNHTFIQKSNHKNIHDTFEFKNEIFNSQDIKENDSNIQNKLNSKIIVKNLPKKSQTLSTKIKNYPQMLEFKTLNENILHLEEKSISNRDGSLNICKNLDYDRSKNISPINEKSDFIIKENSTISRKKHRKLKMKFSSEKNHNFINNEIVAKKFLKKLRSINLDDSNKINLRIRKCFIVIKNILFCFLKKKRDYKTISITNEITKHELNIVNITKKLIEYENLKNILIENEKIESLKFLQKRIFYEHMTDENIKEFYTNIYSVKSKDHDIKINNLLNY